MDMTLLPADTYLVVNKSILTEFDKKVVKCAQPVGDTMGRFHPHG